MKTLITPVGSYLTSDAMADAAMQYWAALGAEGCYGIADIAILDARGAPAHLRLGLGGATTLAVIDADTTLALIDSDAAEALLARTRTLTRSAHGALSDQDIATLSSYDGEFSASQ